MGEVHLECKINCEINANGARKYAKTDCADKSDFDQTFFIIIC